MCKLVLLCYKRIILLLRIIGSWFKLSIFAVMDELGSLLSIQEAIVVFGDSYICFVPSNHLHASITQSMHSNHQHHLPDPTGHHLSPTHYIVYCPVQLRFARKCVICLFRNLRNISGNFGPTISHALL